MAVLCRRGKNKNLESQVKLRKKPLHRWEEAVWQKKERRERKEREASHRYDWISTKMLGHWGCGKQVAGDSRAGDGSSV